MVPIVGIVIVAVVIVGVVYWVTLPPPEAAELYPFPIIWVGATCEAPYMLLATVHHDVGEKYGIDVEGLGFAGIGAYKEGLDKGTIASGPGPTYLIPASEAGLDIKYTMSYHAGCIDLVVPVGDAGAWYEDPTDLVGKTIAIGEPSDSPNFTLFKILMMNGIDPTTDVDIITVPYGEMPMALEKGEIDAFISWEPVPLMAESLGIGRIAINTALDAPYNELTCCYMSISGKVPEWAAENFMRAFAEEMYWIMTHKEETAHILFEEKLLLGEEEDLLTELEWFTFYPRSPGLDLVLQTETLQAAGFVEMSPITLAGQLVWDIPGVIEELQEEYSWPATW